MSQLSPILFLALGFAVGLAHFAAIAREADLVTHGGPRSCSGSGVSPSLFWFSSSPAGKGGRRFLPLQPASWAGARSCSTGSEAPDEIRVTT